MEHELFFQNILNRSDELINYIDQYEQTTIAYFESEKAKDSDSKKFIDELKLLHKTSLERLKSVDTQNIEIDELDYARF